MKKHLCSSLGLALLLLAWGGANNEVKADVTYTKVQEVNFNADQDGYIPNGWIVNNEGEIRSDHAEPLGSGPRLFSFSSSVQTYKKGLYIRAKETNEGYAYYGTEADYKLEIPTGNIELRVPAFLWSTQGTCKAKVSVLKYDSEKEIADMDVVASETQGLTYVGKNQDLSGVETIKVRFTNETAGNFIVKVDAVNGGTNWTEIVFAGFSLYTYEGTPNKYDDPLLVLEEKFADVEAGYAPGVGSGWTFYKSGTAMAKGANLSGDSRIMKVTNCAELSSSFFFRVWGNDGTTYMIYGEEGDGEPTLNLSAGKYQISYYAANWDTTATAKMYFSLLKGADVIYTRTDVLVNVAGEDKDGAFSADHIQFVVDIEEEGNYQMKFYGDQKSVFGNISVRQDVSTALDETFSGLSHAVPAAGSGWNLYNNSGTLIAQGTSGIGSGPRFFGISGYSGISNVAYLGSNSNCHLTYGEDGSGQTLTLVGGKEYRITYYAANWDGSTEWPRTITCSIDGKNDEGNVFSRSDVLSGRCNNQAWSAKYLNNPDFIQATFTPKTSGNYVLTFTGDATVVTNITLADNDENGIAFATSLDKFGYTSLYLDQAVGIPSGVQAYIGKLNEAKDAIVLTELGGDAIPANTGVILVGKANAELTLYPTEAVDALDEDNILQGTAKGVKASSSDDVYVLGYKSTDETPAFYKNTTKKINATIVTTIEDNLATIVSDYDITEGSTTSHEQTTATGEAVTTTTTTDASGKETVTTKVNYTAGTVTKSYEYVQVIRANKAYFVLPASVASAPSLRIQFGADEPGNVTAIEQIETESAAAARVIYDLSGRRLTEMTKPGLYIVNGRKMLMR